MFASRILTATLVISGALLFAGCANAEPPVIEVTPTEDTTVDAVDLSVGMCFFDESDSTTISSVNEVDCASSHDVEVFATILLADGPFPAADALAQTATEQCTLQFGNFVGVAYGSSALQLQYLVPSVETWNAGDRELVCLIFDPAGPVTGSLEGVAR